VREYERWHGGEWAKQRRLRREKEAKRRKRREGKKKKKAFEGLTRQPICGQCTEGREREEKKREALA